MVNSCDRCDKIIEFSSVVEITDRYLLINTISLNKNYKNNLIYIINTIHYVKKNLPALSSL